MVTIYFEGAGDEKSLKTRCRKGFSQLFQKAGFKGKMPDVRPMGRRDAAFKAFRKAHPNAGNGLKVMLLVDSEEIPADNDAWSHLKKQDGWCRPKEAQADQAQMMVSVMETWLITDPEAFADYFKKDFKKSKLPATDLEKLSKQDVYEAIENATKTAKPKGKYGKARDSFEILGRIDPKKLRKACAWAERFFNALEKHG
jgi:hypothetical protein